MDDDEFEVSQTRSVDDNFTPEQDEPDNLNPQCENPTPMTVDIDLNGAPMRQI